jgi:hypothetical protein
MAFKKFKKNEVLTNTMRSFPSVDFFIYNGKVYYNQTPSLPGVRAATDAASAPIAITHKVKNVPAGYINLYEYNIDRGESTTGRSIGVDPSIPDTGMIYPWISKDSAGSSFKTVGEVSYATEFDAGDILRSTYPLSASITSQYMALPSSSADDAGDTSTGKGVYNRAYMALRNRLNYLGARSPHYMVTSSHGNYNSKPLNIIHIPSIFYGTRIEPGTVSLKWYFTGSLAGELRDKNRNGELIQVTSSDSPEYNSKVAGVVMYEEGFILLTGSWKLNNKSIHMHSADTTLIPPRASLSDAPRWKYFGAGANDGNNTSDTGATFNSASFAMSFKGRTETQVLTMFAHAKRGEVNYSNNPTFIKKGQDLIFKTSSAVYHESDAVELVNFASSSYLEHSASFKRQVYISKVAIYDKSKNLIGVATLGSPVLKEGNQDYTFKLKLDI